MASLTHFVAVALSQRGDPYVFGAEAEFSDPDPDRFDCSELVQWSAARCGVRFADGAQNQRDACRRADRLIPVAQARKTAGALLFRIDEGPSGDHVAISLGDDRTIEARGAAYGVNIFPAKGRTWTHAGLIPGFDAGGPEPGQRLLERGAHGEDVRWVQRRLQAHGFDPGPADGVFGPRTDDAVRKFQTVRHLSPDGIVGPLTRRELVRTPTQTGAGK